MSMIPDLVLLDRRLPSASGEDILAQLASSEVASAIPVLMLSGDAGESFIGCGNGTRRGGLYDQTDRHR